MFVCVRPCWSNQHNDFCFCDDPLCNGWDVLPPCDECHWYADLEPAASLTEHIEERGLV